MDPTRSSFQPTDELWRLQADIKSVSNVQAEHSDRLLRLERRMDDETRMKSVWGPSSPFPGVLSGTPQQDAGYNPAAEAFKTFDQDQSTSLLGGLHLESEEEPRRGASRANSVRFDESALHSHFGHNSRSSSEFFPIRTGSAFGSHPLTERSSSHKSEGRQSSTGQSAHSTRLNSLGQDTRSPGLTMALPAGPPPGLLILGPLPGIIRCWLDTNFTNESLLYAAVCSGSYKSLISFSTIQRLGFVSRISTLTSSRSIRLRVYLPEATVQYGAGRSGSPAPQLPSITVTFEIVDTSQELDAIGIVIGSDILRAKNADILFSKNQITLLDDERNRLEIPLARPEKEASFKSLVTISNSTATVFQPGALHRSTAAIGSQNTPVSSSDDIQEPTAVRPSRDLASSIANVKFSDTISKEPGSKPTPGGTIRGTQSTTESSFGAIGSDGRDEARPSNGFSGDTRKTDLGKMAGSWRRDQPNQPSDSTFSSIASGVGTPKSIRGKSMKILRPSRSGGTSKSMAGVQPPTVDTQFSVWGSETPSQRGQPHSEEAADRSAGSSIPKSPYSDSPVGPGAPSDSKGATMNPIGGGSAFQWLGGNKPR